MSDGDTGLFIAYAVIGAMAVVPIYYGSYSSLDRLKSSYKKKREHEKKAEFSDSEDEDEDESEAVTSEDAYMFPVYGSVALFSMYIVFKYLRADWINMLLSAYFAVLGVAALTQVGVRMVKGATGVKLPQYHVSVEHRSKTLVALRFTNLHLATLGVSAVLTAGYLYSKNWVVSNMFGLAFSFSAINLIRLDSFKTGMIMLAGLFVYDIFWVFGTEVMVSVAKSFDAPIKVVFPRNLVGGGDEALRMTMLGLGDIVVPGIFVALCLRFDRQQYLAKLGYARDQALPPALNGRHRGFPFATPYFNSAMAAYVAGLTTTIAVMHRFKAAQPALLYLSPACILSVVLTGMARGEMAQVFAYSEEAKEKKNKEEVEEEAKAGVEMRQGQPQQHRYNLRNQTVSATPMSGGELADDEQDTAATGEKAGGGASDASDTASDGGKPAAAPAAGKKKKKAKAGKAAKPKAKK
ncbi:hypothetical protein GGI15_003989 [Coemansia interrupta]|uniref:Minor histocompatibility antigen H13 n=1 Tax=Coemansia interrupta TaxID=1126814 RepID=A0A9W8H6S0_9FUNG|nr:hypothetical protein GGI15_003989 [Coemansia interrupta]